MLLATLFCPNPTRYAFAPPVPKEQAGRPTFKLTNVLMASITTVGVALRGHPLGPKHVVLPTNGHGAPPLQLFL
jgi:hypothetical protein